MYKKIVNYQYGIINCYKMDVVMSYLRVHEIKKKISYLQIFASVIENKFSK